MYKKRRSKPKPISVKPPHVIKPAHRTIAKQVIQDGMPLKTAMMAAGYAKSTSSAGYHNLKKRFPSLWDAMNEEMQAWVKATKNLPKPSERANIATARLLINAAAGEDGGTAAAKLLWQDREVNRLTPDAQVGIFNMAIPQDLKEFFCLPDEPPTTVAGRLNDDPARSGGDVFAQSEELLAVIRPVDNIVPTLDEPTKDTNIPDVPQPTRTDVPPDGK